MFMREWTMDLHLHTCLSPCGDEEMTPPRVLGRVRDLGIEVIAVTDHNTAENVPAFVKKGQELGIKVIPGMEVQTGEDIHLVCLFDTVEQVFAWQRVVYDHLPPLENKKKSLGEQWVVDAEGNKLYEVEKLLLVGTHLSVDEVAKKVQEMGGLCLAAHIDRQAFSLWGHLGFIPGDLLLSGVELTPHLPRCTEQLSSLAREGISYVVSSDAHRLEAIQPPQCFAYLEECTVTELKRALARQEGRYVRTLR
jgi:hypothetical protein